AGVVDEHPHLLADLPRFGGALGLGLELRELRVLGSQLPDAGERFLRPVRPPFADQALGVGQRRGEHPQRRRLALRLQVRLLGCMARWPAASRAWAAAHFAAAYFAGFWPVSASFAWLASRAAASARARAAPRASAARRPASWYAVSAFRSRLSASANA